MIGKTVARIEERPTDPEYGYARDDTLLIHFTDGTALQVKGSSYEEVSLTFDEIGPDELRTMARAAQGRREQERIARLKREEWESVSDEERERRTVKRRAKMSPLALAMEDNLSQMARSMFLDMNRPVYGDGNTFSIPIAKKKRARRS